MKKITLLLILVLSLTACKTRVFGVEVGLQTPTARQSSSATPDETAPATQPESKSTLPSPATQATTPATGIVCFDENIGGGNLRVRNCAGLECAEIGLLEDGEQVSTNGERKDVDGSTWLHVVSPIDGWVNIRYICEGGQDGSNP